jgi:hypothetical protein
LSSEFSFYAVWEKRSLTCSQLVIGPRAASHDARDGGDATAIFRAGLILADKHFCSSDVAIALRKRKQR